MLRGYFIISLAQSRKEFLKRAFVPNPNAFTRRRKLDLVDTIGHIVEFAFSRSGSGAEITSQNYFASLGRPVTKASVKRSSFSEARSQILSDAFEYLLSEANVETKCLKSAKWKGHHVRAVDGTTLNLPATAEVLRSFPRRPSFTAGHYPEGRVLVAMNLITGQPIRAHLGNYHASEREQLRLMLLGFKKGDLVVADEGLWGREMWSEFERLHQFYVTRVQVIAGASLKQVTEFLATGKSSQIAEYQWGKQTYKVRLIRLKKLDRSGEPIVLATNLLSQKRYPSKEIIRLYMHRWNIETMFYKIKELLCVEHFHSKTVNGIRQEIWTNLLIMSFTALLNIYAKTCRSNRDELEQINLKNLIEVLHRNIVLLFGALNSRHRRKRLETCINELLLVRCRKQPGRSNPRRSHQPRTAWNTGPLGKNRPKTKRERELMQQQESC